MNHPEWLFIHFLPSIGFVLALFLLVHLLRDRRSPSSTFAWLLAIILIPYVGVPLYLFFGGRKMKKMTAGKRAYQRKGGGEKKETLMGLPGGFRAVYNVETGNDLAVLNNGHEAFRRLMQALEEARSSIYIATYMMGNDETGRVVMDLLTRKAADGVRVRLMLDALGSFQASRRNLNRLKEAGGKVAFFMPMMPLPFRGRANLRNHRKIILIDEKTVLLGGMNLAHEYMGPEQDETRWKDLSFFVQGPIVADLVNVFISDWRFAAKEEILPASHRQLPAASAETVPLQVMPSGPDVEGDPLHEAIVTAIFGAKNRIWVVTPYFIPDEMLLRSLAIAARRGVDVRVIVPHRSNHPVADLVRKSYLRQLADSDVRIFCYLHGMMHGKLILIDEHLAITGSANMDMRSLFLNYEITLFIHSASKVGELSDWAECLMKDSRCGVAASHPTADVLEGVARLLAPLL